MKSAFVVLATLVVFASSQSIIKKHVLGLKKLLKHLDENDAYPSCNIILFSELVDYDTAIQRCQRFKIAPRVEKDGVLATVNDVVKNKDLQLLLNLAYPINEIDPNKWSSKHWVWAGLQKVKNNSGKINRKAGYVADEWLWASGTSPGDYQNWIRRQPDQNMLRRNKNGCNEKDGCYQNQMRINNRGKWDDTYKFKVHPYACDYQGKYILSDNHKTWSEAKAACEAAGLHLAILRNPTEVAEMEKAAELFLRPVDESKKIFYQDNWIWIGGTDADSEDDFVWAYNGDSVEVKNFFRKNPDNAEFLSADGQDVLAIAKWGVLDDSYDHKRRKRPFACQCPDS